MPYRTELHTHTATVSPCGRITPEESVAHYLAAGYTTVVLTEHFAASSFDAHSRYRGDPNDPDARVDFYLSGVEALRRAAAAAEARGEGRLHILLGLEVRLDIHYRTDYLVYGVTEAQVRRFADLCACDIPTFSERVHAEGLPIYQAHPFRDGMIITNPRYLDGYEVYNGQPRHYARNDMACLWAARFGLPGISGSDLHGTEQEVSGGILTDTPIPDNEALLRVLASGNYSLIRAGHPQEDPPHDTPFPRRNTET